jgi:hypothetical protein
MSEDFRLNDRQFASALRILEREQQRLVPSAEHVFWYYCLNVLVFILAVLLAVVVIHEWGLADLSPIYNRISGRLIGGLTLSGAGLLLLNVPFMINLQRHARLRRKLGLAHELQPLFRRRERRGGRLLFLASLLATILIVSLSVMPAAAPSLAIRIGLPFTAVAILVLSLMRRQKGRLSTVRRLQRVLDKDSAGAAPAAVPRAAVNEIARIERSQIIGDRLESLRQGARPESWRHYDVQLSRAVIDRKQKLDAATASLVAREIFSLMDDPHPKAAPTEPASGLSVQRVTGTPLLLGFQVDDRARRLRIFYLSDEPITGDATFSHAEPRVS